ncbi:MAG: O-antigen ligase family protein, partial [Pseudomonas sp.]
VAAVLAFGLLAVFRDNDRVENIIFHTDENSLSATSSNEQRASAIQDGLADLANEPFGRGPGTAGPASAHNSQPARIAENYYLQIGQETGWLGLGLFVAIVWMVGRRLWHRRSDPLARALFVSLIGLSFISLVQHAWTDDTLAILWWGLAGVAMAISPDTGKAVYTSKHE